MASDPIFHSLTPDNLLEICTLLSFNPVVSIQPVVLLSGLDPSEKLVWLGSNRNAVESEISSVGSWGFGRADKSYADIVRDVAEHVGIYCASTVPTSEIERRLVTRACFKNAS